MTDCPICRHALAGHGPSCAEAGCACIFDPKGARAFGGERRPLGFGSFESVSSKAVRPPLDPAAALKAHPIFAAFLLSAAAGLTLGILLWLEGRPWAARWLSALPMGPLKAVLGVLLIPGIFILQVWVPGGTVERGGLRLTRSGVRLILILLVLATIAALVLWRLDK